MLRGEDIVLLLKLVDTVDWTVRTLEEETGIARSVVHRSIKRLAAARLLDEPRRQVNLAHADEFLVHAVRYVFPGRLEGESRGVVTAWAAEPLASHIASPAGALSPVWPDALGEVRGVALRPVHPVVPDLARRDPTLGGSLALVDALRLGDARVRGVATKLLRERLGVGAPA
jgi:hypothetical protein